MVPVGCGLQCSCHPPGGAAHSGVASAMMWCRWPIAHVQRPSCAISAAGHEADERCHGWQQAGCRCQVSGLLQHVWKHGCGRAGCVLYMKTCDACTAPLQYTHVRAHTHTHTHSLTHSRCSPFGAAGSPFAGFPNMPPTPATAATSTVDVSASSTTGSKPGGLQVQKSNMHQ